MHGFTLVDVTALARGVGGIEFTLPAGKSDENSII
jgi:hypothetical protein